MFREAKWMAPNLCFLKWRRNTTSCTFLLPRRKFPHDHIRSTDSTPGKEIIFFAQNLFHGSQFCFHLRKTGYSLSSGSMPLTWVTHFKFWTPGFCLALPWYCCQLESHLADEIQRWSRMIASWLLQQHWQAKLAELSEEMSPFPF